jgi:hypothetical protein
MGSAVELICVTNTLPMGATFINPVESGGKLLREFNQPIVSIDEWKLVYYGGAFHALARSRPISPRRSTNRLKHIEASSQTSLALQKHAECATLSRMATTYLMHAPRRRRRS